MGWQAAYQGFLRRWLADRLLTKVSWAGDWLAEILAELYSRHKVNRRRGGEAEGLKSTLDQHDYVKGFPERDLKFVEICVC